mgnify:CR=1 FL=1
MGKFTAPIQSSTRTCCDTFYVVEGTSGSLLSWKTSTDLELLKVVQPIITQSTPTVDQLTSEYHDLFQGLGKLKNYQVKLHIDETIPPVAQLHRHAKQLRRDEELGVIKRVEEPTAWVSPIVVEPKPKSPGNIRVCIDMCRANKAIKYERHITPTIK